MAVVQNCCCVCVYAFTHMHLKVCGNTPVIQRNTLVLHYSLVLLSQGMRQETRRAQQNVIIP